MKAMLLRGTSNEDLRQPLNLEEQLQVTAGMTEDANRSLMNMLQVCLTSFPLSPSKHFQASCSLMNSLQACVVSLLGPMPPAVCCFKSMTNACRQRWMGQRCPSCGSVLGRAHTSLSPTACQIGSLGVTLSRLHDMLSAGRAVGAQLPADWRQ